MEIKHSPFPPAFKSVHGLGAGITYFPVRNLFRWVFLLIGLCLLFTAIVVLVIGGLNTYFAVQDHGPTMIAEIMMGPFLSGLGLVVLGLVSGIIAVAQWNKGILIFEQGIAARDWRGVLLWRWDEITIMKSISIPVDKIKQDHGSIRVRILEDPLHLRLVLGDDLSEVEELAKRIEEHVFPHLYASLAENFNSGRLLQFGAVELNKQALTIHRTSVEWSKVISISLTQGFLRITHQDGKVQRENRLPIGAIPNLSILMSIVQQLVKPNP